MAAAALVRPDRLDKPSFMLAGQPEEEVSERSRLLLTVDDMKYDMWVSVDLILIMKIASRPPQRDQRLQLVFSWFF